MSAPKSILTHYSEEEKEKSNKTPKAPVLLQSQTEAATGMPWWGWLLIVVAVIGLAGGVYKLKQSGRLMGGGKTTSPAIRVIEPNVDSVISDLTSF